MAASWGGKDNGFGLAKCCSDDKIDTFPDSATTLHFEFYSDVSRPAQGAGSTEMAASAVTTQGSLASPALSGTSINVSKVLCLLISSSIICNLSLTSFDPLF